MMTDGCKFSEKNRLTKHASIWHFASLKSSEKNSFTLELFTPLFSRHLSHITLLEQTAMQEVQATYANKSPSEKQLEYRYWLNVWNSTQGLIQ